VGSLVLPAFEASQHEEYDRSGCPDRRDSSSDRSTCSDVSMLCLGVHAAAPRLPAIAPTFELEPFPIVVGEAEDEVVDAPAASILAYVM